MSTRENLSYQGELPAVSYHRNDSPDATAKVGGDAVSGQVSAESAARYPPGRRRGIQPVSTESTAGAGLGIGSSYAVTIL